MRIDDRMIEEIALLVQAGDLAAVAEARVDGHRALLPHGGGQQQLAEVLPEDLDALAVGLLLGLAQHLAADRRLQQALEGVGHGFLDLLGRGAGRVAVFLAVVVVDLGVALVGVGLDADVQESFVLRAQDGEQVVRGDAVERHLEIEIAAVFGRLGAVAAGLGDPGRHAPAAEDPAQVLADDRGLAEALRDDVARAGQRRVHVRDLVAHELAGVRFRVARLAVPEQVGERLQAELAGGRGAGAPLGPPGEVEVLQLRGGDAVFNPFAQLVGQRARLGNRPEDGLLALLHLGEDVHPVADLRHVGVVHAAGLLLAVAADEGDGVAVREQVGAVLHLPVLQAQQAGDVPDIDLFHDCLGWSLRKRRASTPQNASPKMPPDILDVPSLRLTKMTGTSVMRKPSLWAVYFSSIWKP